jgi:hypothetical protein
MENTLENLVKLDDLVREAANKKYLFTQRLIKWNREPASRNREYINYRHGELESLKNQADYVYLRLARYQWKKHKEYTENLLKQL